MVRFVARNEDVLGLCTFGMQTSCQQLSGQRRSHGRAQVWKGQRQGLDQDGTHGKETVRVHRLRSTTNQNHQVRGFGKIHK